MNDTFYERFVEPFGNAPDDFQGIAWGKLCTKKELIDKGFTLIGYPESEKYNCFYGKDLYCTSL